MLCHLLISRLCSGLQLPYALHFICSFFHCEKRTKANAWFLVNNMMPQDNKKKWEASQEGSRASFFMTDFIPPECTKWGWRLSLSNHACKLFLWVFREYVPPEMFFSRNKPAIGFANSQRLIKLMTFGSESCINSRDFYNFSKVWTQWSLKNLRQLANLSAGIYNPKEEISTFLSNQWKYY